MGKIQKSMCKPLHMLEDRVTIDAKQSRDCIILSFLFFSFTTHLDSGLFFYLY